MNDDKKTQPLAGKTLRERAETLLDAPLTDLSSIPHEEILSLIHELQIHQVELELQNEELRQAQVDLAHSRDRYSDLYDFSPVGYLSLSPDGAILQANLTAATMLGSERARLTGRQFTESLVAGAQDTWHIHHRRLLAGDCPETCELELRPNAHPGSVVELHSIPHFDEDGAVSHIRCALADVTSRNAAERVLAELNIGLEQSLSDRTGELQRTIERVALLSEALSNLGEGVVITEGGAAWPGPTIIFVNEALCAITGYSAEELIGETPRILQGTDTDPQVLKRIRDALSEHRSFRCELTNYRKDGSPYDAEIWINPMPDTKKGNRAQRFIGIHRDISKRKQAERLLKEPQRVQRKPDRHCPERLPRPRLRSPHRAIQPCIRTAHRMVAGRIGGQRLVRQLHPRARPEPPQKDL